jgi:predicted hotdog family 3-hydroxylacyl-ACP dehydratase
MKAMTTPMPDTRSGAAPQGPWPPHPMDDWVPHRGAMSLLDRIEHCDDQGVVACVRVPAEGLFLGADGMPAWVGIEYMAQAVAAWSGARARAGGGSPRIGFLLGSRRYEAQVPAFAIGADLRVFAHCELTSENGLGIFDCRIVHDGQVLATGRLSVFEPAAADSGEASPATAGGGRGEGQEP